MKTRLSGRLALVVLALAGCASSPPPSKNGTAQPASKTADAGCTCKADMKDCMCGHCMGREKSCDCGK